MAGLSVSDLRKAGLQFHLQAPTQHPNLAWKAWVDALRRELETWHIPVILVAPGTVRTPIWEKSISATDRRIAAMSQEAQSLYGNQGDAVKRVMNNGLKSAVSADQVAQVLLKAMEKKHPSARYQVGRDARLAALSVFVPDIIKDWLIRNILNGKLSSIVMGW